MMFLLELLAFHLCYPLRDTFEEMPTYNQNTSSEGMTHEEENDVRWVWKF